ncbi:Kinesin-like protein tea2 [Yarrowia sp. C11]|nr:Kinesin-like protein tea2 [Yarrowia sp. C11]
MRQFRPQTPSRPQTPVLRRPASTMSMRSNRMGDISPLRRPQTPLSTRETYQGTISVGVRVKPSTKPLLGPPTPQLQLSDNRIETDLGEFTFDNVYAPGCANRDVFESSVRDLVGNVMNGFNGTVFAYGMTGTGKTHSMQGTSTDPGIIPLSAETLFAAASTGDYKVRVSYLEIYNEHLNDLLCPSTPSEDIKLREDALRGVRAYGLKEVLVSSPAQLLDVVQHLCRGLTLSPCASHLCHSLPV